AHPPQARTIGILVLLIGFLTGPIVWSLHLVVSEFLISAACAPGAHGSSGFALFGVAGWRVVLLAETGALAFLVFLAGLISFRAWRQSGIGEQVTGAAGGAPGRSGWMALAGVALSAMFLFGILLAGLGIFWMDICT
ncbi:MAG TPA: hypothetical protein VFA70_13735, partial [Dehalococcoidia bacterium]|nr:hypothetical protein [Dehalococcoidia bacterium]